MFAGYGTATFALKSLGIEHEVVGFSEIDKYAIQCFQQNHGSKNYGDCTKINPSELPDFDLLTGGFPCQAFSQAGKQLGELDPRGTLFYEIIRIAEVKQPKYMVLENVKGLTTKKFKDTFDKILSELDRIGYKVYWKVLNTKDYGIPQNRERVFFVCIRKDIEQVFEFPEREKLFLRVENLLETPEYRKLSTNKRIYRILNSPTGKDNPKFELKNDTPSGISRQKDRIYTTICPTLNCTLKEYLFEIQNVIIILTPKECFRLQGFLKDEINIENIPVNQQYKLAGNGQSVNVVKKIFERLLK